MMVLKTVMMAFALTFMVQVFVWRIVLPKNQSLTLAKISGLSFVAAMFLSKRFFDISFWEGIHCLMFFLAVTFVYIVTLLGTKDVGPSILIMRQLESTKNNGSTLADFYSVVTNEYLIETRVHELLNSHLICMKYDKFVITRRGKVYLSFYTFYRAALGIKRDAG